MIIRCYQVTIDHPRPHSTYLNYLEQPISVLAIAIHIGKMENMALLAVSTYPAIESTHT